ncbi:hypothetical protein BY996DRAFT_6487744 [Phakopsora pachyrhizi]|nr:hypothetical protein BY996DRAFT_6487744 [Phakopsora pachyrhizi]
MKKQELNCITGSSNESTTRMNLGNKKVGLNEGQSQWVVVIRGILRAKEAQTDRLDYDLRGWEPVDGSKISEYTEDGDLIRRPVYVRNSSWAGSRGDVIGTSMASTAKLLRLNTAANLIRDLEDFSREVLKARFDLYPPQPSYELGWLREGDHLTNNNYTRHPLKSATPTVERERENSDEGSRIQKSQTDERSHQIRQPSHLFARDSGGENIFG